MYPSERALEFGIAVLSAVALALAFPKAGQAWLAPVGAAGLFWLWQRLSWKRAFFSGWLSGTVFFAVTFWWISFTIGSFIGGFAFAVPVIVALTEGLAFALAAASSAVAARFAPRALAPLAAAAAFTVFEWLRSIGPLGVPFEQLGYTQADTPLGLFAAYAGTYGVTFVICTIGAYAASAIARRRYRSAAVVFGTIALAWALCWAAWPARAAAPPTMRVAAVQGNIAQSLKMKPGALELAIRRYTALTRTVAPFHPQLVVWPETVIVTALDYDPALMARFAGIASEGSAGDQGLSAGPPAPPPSAPADGWPFASPFDLPAPPPRRHDLRSGSTLALLFIALVLLLAGTNPSPAAYVAWAARRIFPEARLAPIRDAAYLAVERATVAESYGVCTIFQTTFTTGTMTVIGIVGQFVTIGNGPPQAPLPGRQPRPQQRSSGGVQI
jgi:hypothetical protein